MDYKFFLLTTFLLENESKKPGINLRCLGAREIIKPDKETPGYILGTIEFESSCIPVVDIGAAFGNEPTTIDGSRCILIVEHNYKSKRLYTGIITQSIEEVEKLAVGIFETRKDSDTIVNIQFVLGMQNSHHDEHEILIESHRILFLLEEPKTKVSPEHSHFLPSGLCNFINELRAMDFLQRQILLEALANEPELWDKESNVMCL
jgi:chemotaxis signal transduction protein